VDAQLRSLLRASRGHSVRQELGRPIAALRACLRRIDCVGSGRPSWATKAVRLRNTLAICRP
jgi:hypothetical protein